MAHWFHRNPLKATGPVTFDLKTVATTAPAQRICSDLRAARLRLLEVVSDPNNDKTTLETAVTNYLGLLHGFINSLDEERPGDSKLRHKVRFRWTNTLLGNTPTEQYDTVFELICMAFNVGLWYTKHAAKLAGKEEPDMEEAKEVHKCLRAAAGIFTSIKEGMVAKLVEQPEKGADQDSRVIIAYIHQCTAEAQEVTIARAVELKHSASIISALAYETSKMFQSADDSLNSLEEKAVGKWKKYLALKSQFYLAYAYNYHGENLLAEDKCGEAIRCLQESVACYEKAEALAKEYASTKGPGTIAKPQEHFFFRRLGPVVRRTLEKCTRENGFIYHQKIPPAAPELELKATYGLVSPEEFKVPDPNALWNVEAYKAFEISETAPPEKNEKATGEEAAEEVLLGTQPATLPLVYSQLRSSVRDLGLKFNGLWGSTEGGATDQDIPFENGRTAVISGISTRVWEYGQNLYEYYSIPGGPQTGQNGSNQKVEGDLPPVKEADIPQSQKDPKSLSGCVIS